MVVVGMVVVMVAELTKATAHCYRNHILAVGCHSVQVVSVFM